MLAQGMGMMAMTIVSSQTCENRSGWKYPASLQGLVRQLNVDSQLHYLDGEFVPAAPRLNSENSEFRRSTFMNTPNAPIASPVWRWDVQLPSYAAGLLGLPLVISITVTLSQRENQYNPAGGLAADFKKLELFEVDVSRVLRDSFLIAAHVWQEEDSVALPGGAIIKMMVSGILTRYADIKIHCVTNYGWHDDGKNLPLTYVVDISCVSAAFHSTGGTVVHEELEPGFVLLG